jgi:hypothetical protein
MHGVWNLLVSPRYFLEISCATFGNVAAAAFVFLKILNFFFTKI